MALVLGAVGSVRCCNCKHEVKERVLQRHERERGYVRGGEVSSGNEYMSPSVQTRHKKKGAGRRYAFMLRDSSPTGW